MRRFLAVLLTTSCPLLCAVPAHAATPLREVEYSVSAVRDGVPYRSVVRVDFLGGSAQNVVTVSVDERDARGERETPYVGIEGDGRLRLERDGDLSDEEEAICSFMSLESEDLAGVARGDHWERQGPAPGGQYLARYAVLDVGADGFLEMVVSRDVRHADGSSSQWRGTMLYDATGVVPAAITLNGHVSGAFDGAASGDVAMSIRLTRDTFKH